MARAFLSDPGWSERAADDYAPYVGHVTDTAVLKTDGSVLGIFKLDGAPFELEDHAARNGRHRFRNAVLRNIADDRLTVVETMVRHDGVPPFPPAPHRSAFAAELEAEYRRHVLAGRERANEWFVTLVVHPRAPAASSWKLLRARLGRQPEAAEAGEDLLRALEDTMLILAKAYAAYRPVRLGLRERGGVVFSEIAEALRLFLTARFLPVPLTDGSLGGAIYTDRVICGRRGFEVRAPGQPSFGCLLGFKEYPDRTRPGMLNELLAAECRLVLTNSFRFHSRAGATGRLSRQQIQMQNAGDRALSQIEALHVAMDDVASNLATMGSHHVSVALHCDSLDELDRRAGEVRAALTNAGANVALEDRGTEAAYWAQLPGNARWRTRPGDISSRNFVGFSSLDGYPRGDATGGVWGTPLLRLLTPAGTPYDFSLHVDDVGHTAIFGPTGSGKTVFLGLLVAGLERAMAEAGGTVVLFDKDNANEILVRALGGRYLTLRSGEDSGMAPLRALADTPDARTWLLRFAVGLIRGDGGPPPDAVELKRLAKGIAFQLRMPPRLRSLAGLCAWLVGEGAGSAGKRLERWGRGGDLGWAFDGEADLFDPDAGLVGVDTSALLADEAVRGPAAAYLLHRIRSVIDGRRFVLAADEFWAYLPDERFARAFEDFALTLRKGNGALVMATQQPEHVLRHPVGATLVSNCRTKLLFRNADADRAAYCGGGAYDGGLNCTPGEFRAVSEDMLAGPRSVLIKRDGGSVVCRVELPEAMAEHVAVLSGRAATVRLLRAIRAERGTDDPSVLIPEFRRRLREAAA
ncbi:helicase HerA domain-containing protein [Roseicella sp. DB1501]|uniref:VirB4 family type IV secretion/conjugal transfer ATPase n=1 Tax=Roseicella sp. DB1501 TaxID=2730925 RepID=UPI00149260C5|nr:DUF87 domain-containing protein [Roseicella sp. DB1501]